MLLSYEDISSPFEEMQINVGYMSTLAILCSLRLLLDGSLLAKISMNNA